MRQDSKRGHYYCTEERSLMRCLDEIRNSKVIESHGVINNKAPKKNTYSYGGNESYKWQRTR